MAAAADNDIVALVVQHNAELDTWGHTLQVIPANIESQLKKQYNNIFRIMGY